MKQNFFEKVDIKGRVRVCLETARSLGVKGKTIVDIGSSIGWIEKELLKYQPQKLIGIEPDSEAVAFARKKVKGASFMEGVASSLPVASGKAGIVTMFDVIEHVPKNTEGVVLKEAARALKRGGKLALSTPNSHPLINILDLAWYFGHRHYSSERIKRLVEDAGFKVETLKVRGGIWSSLNLIHHYIWKWIFKKPDAINKLLIKKDNEQFSLEGIHSIFLTAKKL